MKLYMFRTVHLSIIRSFFTVHTAMVYVIQACCQLASSSVLICSQAVSKPAWHTIAMCAVQWKTPDNGQRNCPKHVEFDSKNKLKISASCWFHYKKLSWSAVNWTSRTPADGQRNCPKHVEFYSKNKFDQLVRLVGFIIRRKFTKWFNFSP